MAQRAEKRISNVLFMMSKNQLLSTNFKSDPTVISWEYMGAVSLTLKKMAREKEQSRSIATHKKVREICDNL